MSSTHSASDNGFWSCCRIPTQSPCDSGGASNSPTSAGMTWSRHDLSEHPSYLAKVIGWAWHQHSQPDVIRRWLELLREARSLNLDLLLGGDEGGHLVTMRRDTAPGWSHRCRGGPEKYTEGTKRLWYNWRPSTSNTWSQLFWPFDLYKPVNCLIISAIWGCTFCFLQLQEAQLIPFTLRSW